MTPIHLVRTPSPGLPSSVADPHRPRPCCTTASYYAPQTCDCRHKVQIRADWFVAHIFKTLTGAAPVQRCCICKVGSDLHGRRGGDAGSSPCKTRKWSKVWVLLNFNCVWLRAERLRHSLLRRSPAHMSNGGADGTSSSGRPSTEEWSFADEPSGKPRESCVKYFDALWFCYCESAAFTAPFSTIVLFMHPRHCGKSAAVMCSHHASSQAEYSMAVRQKKLAI